RGWELLAGAITALYFHQFGRRRLSQQMSGAIGAAGLALILGSIVLLDETTPFPGTYALAPTLGAVMIIACVQEGVTVHRILSHKLFVGIGLISYSAYLWHQPLFAFARQASAGEPSRGFM